MQSSQPDDETRHASLSSYRLMPKAGRKRPRTSRFMQQRADRPPFARSEWANVASNTGPNTSNTITGASCCSGLPAADKTV